MKTIKNTKVIVIGSGPIVIGQGAEFDYSGTQTCLALKEANCEIILINNNPATIMTDPEISDKVYCEPITYQYVRWVIKKERPQYLIASNGGQKALNIAVELHKNKILEKYNLKLLGTNIDAIIASENRDVFTQEMEKINVSVLKNKIANSYEECLRLLNEIKFPVIVRPSYTLGGLGGGICETKEKYLKICKKAISYSPINQCLIEKSIYGYQEIEYEVMRDHAGNSIVVCNMENIEPVGVHTGDSCVTAPSLTLTNKQYQTLRDVAIKMLNHLKIVGGCNVQFALKPNTLEYYVIEINPRVSRSSALASKATGYPIAKISTLLGLGYTLDEIQNPVTKTTTCAFEPTMDYVAIKIPQFGFDKFKIENPKIGSQMQATGEAMALGKTFNEAFCKAIASVQNGPIFLYKKAYKDLPVEKIKKLAKKTNSNQIYQIFALLEKRISIKEIHEITLINWYYLEKFQEINQQYQDLKNHVQNPKVLLNAKKMGISDNAIGKAWRMSEKEICDFRQKNQINPIFQQVDTCAGEFKSRTPYLYTTYHAKQNESKPITSAKQIIIVGSGPIKIGQGIEFDYATSKAVWNLKKLNFKTIVLNNNPETVSTDYNFTDKLFFEPINYETVYEIVKHEKPYGIILQFGGQLAINLSQQMSNMFNLKVLGTKRKSINISEERQLFNNTTQKLNILTPKFITVHDKKDAFKNIKTLNYPLLIRPSYVIGGENMEFVYAEDQLVKYFKKINKKYYPIIIDEYIDGLEIEVDGVSDGEHLKLFGIMEHIDKAGIHSGDSTTTFPTVNISKAKKQFIYQTLLKLAHKLNIKGFINAQFILKNNQIYLIEINLRASRTLPFLYKATNQDIMQQAIKVIVNQVDKNFWKEKIIDKSYNNYHYVKVPIFSFQKIRDIKNIFLGPEMKSTGEAIGVDLTLNKALYKAILATGLDLLKSHSIILSVRQKDKPAAANIFHTLNKVDYKIYATKGTYEYIEKQYPNSRNLFLIDDYSKILNMLHKQDFSFIVNTRNDFQNIHASYSEIIENALVNNTPIFSSISLVKSIATLLLELKFLIHPIMRPS